MRQQVEKVDAEGYPDFDLSAVTSERIDIQRRMGIVSIAQTWGIANHRQTPDFDAIKKLLDIRFLNSTDDIPHEDFFCWNT
jgi:hypothetical protein